MAKSYIDFFETFKGEFLATTRFKNKFIRLWGTEYVDGIEVLKDKFVVYPNTSSQSVQRFLKLINAQAQINSAKFEGVTSYYFWLNSSKADTLSQDNIEDVIVSKINSYCSIGEELSFTLTFSSNENYNYFKGFTKTDIYNYITNDYDTSYNQLENYAIGDTLLTNVVGSYILFDNEEHFNTSLVDAAVVAVPYGENVISNNTRYKASIVIKLKSKRISNVLASSSLITHIIDESNEANRTALQQFLESSTNETVSNESIWIKDRDGKTDFVWYKGQLRVSFLNDKSIKTKDRVKILLSALDTGYTQKKAKWWQKLLGPVLIVIAIVIAVVTAGAGAPISAYLTAIAIATGIAALTMTLLQVYFAKHGQAGAASYMGRWVKISSIISTVTGIAGMLNNLARKFATEAFVQEAVKQGAQETAVRSAAALMSTAELASANAALGASINVGVISTVVKEIVFSSVTSGWQSMVSTAMKVVKFVTDIVGKMKAKSMNSEINSLTEARDKVAEELEDINDKELHIGIENIKWYTDELRSDNLQFEVDYLYEGTQMNIGRPSFYTARGLNVISDDVYKV